MNQFAILLQRTLSLPHFTTVTMTLYKTSTRCSVLSIFLNNFHIFVIFLQPHLRVCILLVDELCAIQLIYTLCMRLIIG